jgi:hypothetical protein
MTTIEATHEEQQRAMPGDVLVPNPMFTATHAITIDVPPECVWPWLSQMGSLRGGWYSYDRIDNGGRPSADRILHEYQQLAPGDVLPCLPGATDAFVVEVVNPPFDLILTVPSAEGPVTSWEHLVEPIEPGCSRLIVRGQVAHGWKLMARDAHTDGQQVAFIEYVYRCLGRLPDSLLIEIAGFGHRFMEAHHLRGIKRRAEASNRTA